jgi:hypothetical protein
MCGGQLQGVNSTLVKSDDQPSGAAFVLWELRVIRCSEKENLASGHRCA